MGWTLSKIGISVSDLSTVYELVSEEDPQKLRISKYLLSEETLLDFAKPTYHQIVDNTKVNEGCGKIKYTP